MPEKHWTDEHQVLRGSSVDIIERCAAFLRQACDFEGVLDYADSEETGKFQEMLQELNKEALRIIVREAKITIVPHAGTCYTVLSATKFLY